jgi:hypothetical protein
MLALHIITAQDKTMTPYFHRPPTAAVNESKLSEGCKNVNESNVADGCELLHRQASGSIIAHILMQPGVASDGLVWKNQP